MQGFGGIIINTVVDNRKIFFSVTFSLERKSNQKVQDVPAWLKINCVPLKALKCHTFCVGAIPESLVE